MKASDLMQAMADAGAPMEAIIIAVRAIEAEQDKVAEARAKDADRTRRYRQRGGGQITPQMRAEVLERDGHQCLECQSTDALEIDHIIPLAKGGHPTDLDNLQTLCRPCNARKRDRIRKADNRGKYRTIADSENVQNSPPLPLPPNDNNSNPPAPTPPEEKPRARKGRTVSAEIELPDDWQPAQFGPDTKSRKIVDSWPPGTLEHQVEHFVAHHRKLGDKFRDWQAAWATWVLNSRKFGNGTDNRKSGGSGGQSRSRDGFLNACADAAMGGHDAGDPFGRPDGGTGDDRPAAVLRLAAHRA